MIFRLSTCPWIRLRLNLDALFLDNLGLRRTTTERTSYLYLSAYVGSHVSASPHRNYILAQAHVDAPALAHSIAHLNTSTTFQPLQPLHDTDVAGYLRHAHEQNLISTIEEGRRETQEDFYRVLEERSRRDWEARKKRIFEELGSRSGSDAARAHADYRKSMRASTTLGVS